MFFFFFKQKTAYEMRISDWSSDVCSSDLLTFTLADDTLLYVDALTADSSLVWTLTGPRGDVASRGFTGSDGYSIGSNPVLAIPAGDYVLRVTNNSAATDRHYALHVLDPKTEERRVGKRVGSTCRFRG